jgi:hypothetical protein
MTKASPIVSMREREAKVER